MTIHVTVWVSTIVPDGDNAVRQPRIVVINNWDSKNKPMICQVSFSLTSCLFNLYCSFSISFCMFLFLKSQSSQCPFSATDQFNYLSFKIVWR